jgi:flagellar basal-body rod modification protein FlgD
MSSAASLSSVYQPSTPPVNPKSSLKSEDFINLLITQLQNQDPLQPMKNNELLQQVSQIGTLQSQTALQTSLESMVLQNQISSASGMIGRAVAGLDDRGAQLVGIVTSVRVENKKVVLELDNGRSLDLGRVTDVGPAYTGPVGGGGNGGSGGGTPLDGGLTTQPMTPVGNDFNGLTGLLNPTVLTPKGSESSVSPKGSR